MSEALFLKADSGQQKCANCGGTYVEHYGDTLRCFPDKEPEPRWFPASIANALKRQKRRIRQAQRDLAKKHPKGDSAP
jgi:hypothetical protein